MTKKIHVEPERGGWLRNNWLVAANPALALVAIFIAMIAWVQPQWSAHTEKDLEATIDRQVDKKLKSTLEAIESHNRDLSAIHGQLEVVLKIVLKNELKELKRGSPLLGDPFRFLNQS